MAKKQTTQPDTPIAQTKPINLTTLLSTKAIFHHFEVWIVGSTPLITHAWSEKARREMLQKQVKAVRAGRETRDPQADFVNSLYEMGNNSYGFPSTGVKKCFLSSAHKDKGIPRTTVLASLWIDAKMIRCRPALAGAVCDMPLLRIYSGSPEMREDMVKIGSGLNKVANLAYRGQFRIWAMKITGRYNPVSINPEVMRMLIAESGVADGLGEWRNSKGGVFGEFHIADEDEQREWELFARGKGPLPVPANYRPEEVAAE